MSLAAGGAPLLTFLLFCRIGGCLMLMPGFSSARVPMQVRLFLALIVTLALAPLLLPGLHEALDRPDSDHMAVLIVRESLTGALLGLTGRVFFLALQFIAAAATSFSGYGQLPGAPLDGTEPDQPLASLIMISATVLFFVADQHLLVLSGLVHSYAVIPVAVPLGPDAGLARLADATSDAFLLALQIGGPFVVYGLIVNLLFGITNKLTPQIPVYFISLPFVMAGGLWLLYASAGEILRLFTAGFESWLARI